MSESLHTFVMMISHQPSLFHKNPKPVRVIYEIESEEVSIGQINKYIQDNVGREISIKYLNFDSMHKWDRGNFKYYACDSLEQLCQWLKNNLHLNPHDT